MKTESEGTKSLWETHAPVDDISWHVVFLGIQKLLNRVILKVHFAFFIYYFISIFK